MVTLYDRSRRAIIRLYDDWFVAYAKAKHLGWLSGNVVYNRRGNHIGWYEDGKLRDKKGQVIATMSGSTLPGMAGIPGRPGRPGFGGISGKSSFSNSWSSMSFEEFFGQ